MDNRHKIASKPLRKVEPSKHPVTPSGPPQAHLGGEVHDSVNVLGPQHVAQKIHGLDVTLDKLHTHSGQQQ